MDAEILLNSSSLLLNQMLLSKRIIIYEHNLHDILASVCACVQMTVDSFHPRFLLRSTDAWCICPRAF